MRHDFTARAREVAKTIGHKDGDDAAKQAAYNYGPDGFMREDYAHWITSQEDFRKAILAALPADCAALAGDQDTMADLIYEAEDAFRDAFVDLQEDAEDHRPRSSAMWSVFQMSEPY